MNHEQYIKKNYKKIPSKEISKILGIPYVRVQHIAKQIGVASFSKKIEAIIPNLLEDYYTNNNPVSFLMGKYKISKSTCLFILKLNGTGGREPWETGIKHKCDLSFFDKIDTPEKAYWFGFIAADGNLYNGKLQIRLKSSDKSHLESFKNRIKYSGSIFKEKDKDICGLIITRKSFYESLKKLGMEENKTLKIDSHIFDNIPDDFKMAALHGYFDGDGSFSKPNKNSITMNLLGNESFLEYIKDYLYNKGLISGSCTITKDKRTKQTFCMNIYLTKDFLKNLYILFYESSFSSKDFLDRKRKRVYTALNYVEV